MSSSPPTTDLATVLVNYNTVHLLNECLGKLDTAAKQSGYSHKVVFVDNQSRDGSAEHVRVHFPNVTVLESGGNLGFGRANNLALPLTQSTYVLLLNTDAFVREDTLRRTLDYMQAHPQCGILGVRLEGREGNLQPSCRYFPTPLNGFLWRTGLARWFKRVRMVDDMNWAHDLPRRCDWVPGCYYLIRQTVIDQVGLFDPRFFMYMEEVDHCRRTQNAGWEIHFFPDTTVVHIGGESAKAAGTVTKTGSQLKHIQVESSLLYYRKWSGLPGAATWLALNLLAELYDTLKLALKGRLDAQARQLWRNNWALLLSAAHETRWGRQPKH
jgi:N-acetylglucosaminyl-diphospho-decaprenol L-rhamnosyltransferase